MLQTILNNMVFVLVHTEDEEENEQHEQDIPELNHIPQDIEIQKICIICDSENDIIVLGCRHSLCYQCLHKIGQRCHMCKHDIDMSLIKRID